VSPYALVIDTKGFLYAANHYSVTVYAPNTTTVLRSLLDVKCPRYIAMNGAAELYVADYCNQRVAVFSAGSSKPSRYITKGVRHVWFITFNHGHLFVSNEGSVAEYAAGGSQPIRVITQGISFARGLAFDKSGNLYVANCALQHYPPTSSGSVTVYPPGSAKLKTKITTGVQNPLSVGVAKGGSLFVANYAGNSVTVYASGGTTPIRSIPLPGERPRVLTFGPAGSAYIGGSLNVFSVPPGATDPSMVYDQGGYAFAWGPR
jgi:hypothetical protein